MKEELCEGVLCPCRMKPATLDSLSVDASQHWSDAPDPVAGQVGVMVLD